MDNFGLLFAKSLGGGGGSGTDNYNELSNKPQINSITLSGNKSLANLGIQAELTFDNEPTEESTNPVTSGAVYTALATKQDTLTVDSAPTENSTNPVQSGGVYTALAGKEDTLTFDDAPTNNSDNPVKSGGIYTALGQKQDTLTFDGTYSASTNAAATVSTVTNAIGALDVTGESGISASKTISAWSETDGKVSVSTQDIAIAGTQAVLTGYTPESPAQTDSILATDTVNAAIKKLDERSRVDENNILLLTENGGGLNILDIQNPVTHVKTSYTPLSNGGVELSCSAPNSAWTNYNIADIPCITGKTYKVYIYIDEVSADPVAFRVYLRRNDSNGANYIDQRITQTGSIAYTITAATNKFWVGIYLNNSETARTVTTKMRMMIVQSDTDVPYQPYAPSNYELYQLIMSYHSGS